MNSHAEKSQQNKSPAAQQRPAGAATQLTDSRPEATQFRKLREMADHSPQAAKMQTLQKLAGDHDKQKNVVQGKWFRMSTLLDDNDEFEVAGIRQLAESGNYLEAFGVIIAKSSHLAAFKTMLTNATDEDSQDAIINTLAETYEDESKAYTVGEVMDLLEENEIISGEQDALLEEDDDEIDALIVQFQQLQISVPFRSDVDQRKEEHHVYWHGDDVIVQSNPKPLKAVVTDEEWEGYKISPPVLTQLEGLRKSAKLALYRISGNAKRNLTGSRTQTNMNSFRNKLEAIAKILANLGGKNHKATLMPETDLSGSVNYSLNASPVEGHHVIAYPLSIKSSASGSKPKDGRLMKSIRNLAGNQSKSYVQMHLLNDLVFGPGQLWNLTPGPKQSNTDMEKNVEDPLKRAVLGKGLAINFGAKVNYNSDPTAASNTQIAQNPDKYRFQDITFSAEQLEYDENAQTWNVAAHQDVDVAKINGAKVNWRYGSLTPLVPKPRILSAATTWQDLTTANIPAAAAKRIAAFIHANPSWWPSSGKNKQKQLAQAVKKWDKKKTLPNTSKWKATSVLWT